jgi:hypothetical protein
MALKDSRKKGIASLALLEVGLLELGLVALVIGVILIILNYFRVISLNDLYPQLTFLPQQNSGQITNIPQSDPSTQIGVLVTCPVMGSSCPSEMIVKDGKLVGVGFSLKQGQEFYAAIPGSALFKTENVEGAANHINIGGDMHEAVYDYFGSPVSSESSKFVFEGNQLGTAALGSFSKSSKGENINLMLKLLDRQGNIIEKLSFQPLN